MRKQIGYFLLIFFILSLFFNLSAEEDWPLLKGPYLGQKPPGTKAEIFAPGIVSAEGTQGYPCFTRNGEAFYFKCGRRGGWVFTERKNNTWRTPAVVPYSKQYGFLEALVSSDGSKLLFCTKHSYKGKGKSDDLDLWMMERSDGKWREPVPFGAALNSNRHEAFPTLSLSGDLYFFREYGDKRGCDIMVSKYVNGTFTPPEILGPNINTEKHECDPWVDPGERYLIYCVRDREGGFGNNDLYVSFKSNTDGWTTSTNLGPLINGESEEITPHLTPDGKYLFFASKRRGHYDIYWVDARIIEELRPDEFKRGGL